MPRRPRLPLGHLPPPTPPPYAGAWLWDSQKWMWCGYAQLHAMIDLAMLRWHTILVLPSRAGDEPPGGDDPRSAIPPGQDPGVTE